MVIIELAALASGYSQEHSKDYYSWRCGGAMPCLCSEWYQKNTTAFDKVRDSTQLAAQLQIVAIEHNFEGALLILNLPTPFTQHRYVVIRHGWPIWAGNVAEEFVGVLRPHIAASALCDDAVAWVAEECSESLRPFKEAVDLRDSSGVTLSVSGGSRVSHSISFVRSGEPVLDTELASLRMRIRCIGGMVSRAAARLGLGLVDSFELTSRELEVLRWTADGKCTHDVGKILGISVNTVNYHVKNLTFKMGCSSKLHAVAYAARWQLI